MFTRGGSFMQRRAPQRDRGQDAVIASLPAPIGGWNARDALAAMPETDAVTLINWFPTPSQCIVRQGHSNWATGFPSAVETIAPWEGNTSERLFACAGGAIYDATASGPVGAPVQSGLLSNRWQQLQFTTAGGVRYLMLVNGADSPRFWDGTNWITITGASSPAITGLTTSEIANITSHKSRVWLIRRNSLEAYYLPVGAAGGAAALFDLRAVFKLGGTLLAAETWTVDGGTGVDDLLVFATDQGEIAIYQGTDPTSAATWALRGVYYVGGVIGRRCLQRFGGDLLVICQDGLYPLSRLLQSTVLDKSQSLTDKIQFAIGEAVKAYGANFGWQTVLFPRESMLLLNVPISGTEFEQYVMNTITGAWCRFTGWPARCWALWNDVIYFGAGTTVAKAWDGYDDAGTNILTDLKSAFSYFGARGQLKQWTMVRPIVASDGNPGITYGLNVDFDDADVAGTPSFVPASSGAWDFGVWDTATWGGGITIQKRWQFLSGLGYCGALRMKTTSRGVQVQLSAIDYAFRPGAVL